MLRLLLTASGSSFLLLHTVILLSQSAAGALSGMEN